MEPITSAMIAAALAQGLWEVSTRLAKEGVVDAALEPATERMKGFVQRGYDNAREDEALQKAVQAALQVAGAPAEDEEELDRWLKGVSLDRLVAEKNRALRREVARPC